jgi:hypothetical protein
MKTKRYTADFETTTDPNDCRVWAFAICPLDNIENVMWGNRIDGFFNWMKNNPGNVIYFHNLKFDGEFILHLLFESDFQFVPSNKNMKKGQFTALISDKGQWYSLEICTDEKKPHTRIYDSLKILPFSVDEITKAFDLPICKLKIDYDKYREPGYILDQNEIEYVCHDVKIVAMALKILLDQGMNKITQGSNALADYKSMTPKFKKWFPVPEYDEDIRQAYKGGVTYLKKGYEGKDIEEGIVFDVNSLYPWVLAECPLPTGEGKFFKGKYVEDKRYDLYIQMFKCSFELKEGYMPTIQLKNNLAFIPTQYLESSMDDDGVYQQTTLCLTNVDLDLFLEHYDIWDVEWLSGWKFKSSVGMFKHYVDKWIKIKIQADKDKNKPMRTLAKLMLNALYGKFGLNPNVQSKYPYLENGIVKYQLGPKEKRTPIYIPVAVFVTSWGRKKTIDSAQLLWDRFIYCDTDSLHIKGWDIPKELDVDPYHLGAWKLESHFVKARFIRQKSYIEYITCYDENMERPGTKIHVTCAGLPHNLHHLVNWNNFHENVIYEGKLTFKHVKGGVILKSTEFTLKG